MDTARRDGTKLRLTRRALVGAGALGLPVLAACGGPAPTAAPPTPAPKPASLIINTDWIGPNPRGQVTETWYHRAGCRRYVVVERDTSTNEVKGRPQ